jgi:hypothetical protein
MSNLSELLPTGGGQNAVDFVASGTLSSGQTVVLKADGTVEAVAETANPENIGSATVYANAGSTTYNSAVFDSANNKLLLLVQCLGQAYPLAHRLCLSPPLLHIYASHLTRSITKLLFVTEQHPHTAMEL